MIKSASVFLAPHGQLTIPHGFMMFMSCFVLFFCQLRAEHLLGEFQRMNLVEAKLRQAVALKNDVIDELKDDFSQLFRVTSIMFKCSIWILKDRQWRIPVPSCAHVWHTANPTAID